MKSLALVVTLIALPALAQSQGDPDRQAAAAARQADAELATEYDGAMARMRQADDREAVSRSNPTSRQAVLAVGQGPWVAFRDSQCIVEGYDANGGPTEARLVNECRVRLTRARSGELCKALKQ